MPPSEAKLDVSSGQNIFQFKELFFHIQATAETGKGTVLADDAVTWNNDWYRIFAVGHADSAACLGVTNPFGNFSVACRPAKGDFSQFQPHALLEGCAFGSDFQLKLLSVTGKIFGKLPEGFFERGFVVLPAFGKVFLFRGVGEVECFQDAVITNEKKFSDGTMVIAIVFHDLSSLFLLLMALF